MPIYEYECPACCNIFEVQQKISDAALTDCPECGGAVRKLVSMSSFQLKGGGWYADGYKGQSNGISTSNKKQDSKDKKSSPPCQGGSSACQGCSASV